MTNDDRIDSGDDDAAQAFAALQAEIAILHQAVAALPAMVEGATRTTDYTPIREFHQRVSSGLVLALNVFATRDLALARQLFAEKATMRDAERRATESHFQRLRSGRPESIETSAIHLDIIRDLKRIHGHIASIGYPILESANVLRDSRLREVRRALERD